MVAAAAAWTEVLEAEGAAAGRRRKLRRGSTDDVRRLRGHCAGFLGLLRQTWLAIDQVFVVPCLKQHDDSLVERLNTDAQSVAGNEIQCYVAQHLCGALCNCRGEGTACGLLLQLIVPVCSHSGKISRVIHDLLFETYCTFP